MVAAVMRVFVAVLLALAIVAAQLVYGGLMRTVFGIPCYALVALAGILGVSAVFWKRAVPPRLEAVGVTLLAAGYLLWRSWNSTGQDLSLFYTFLVAGCAVVYCLFACVVTSPGARYVFVLILLAAALGQVVVAGIQFSEPGYFWPVPWFSEQMKAWYFKPDATYLRGHGLFLNANHLAWFLNGMVFFALGAACLGRVAVWAKVLFAYLAAVCIAGTVLTLSRGGMLGLAAGMVVFLFLSFIALGIGARDRRLGIFLVTLTVLAIGVGGGYYLFSQSFTVKSRMERILDDTYRVGLWPTALRQAQIEPLTGTGAGSFTQLSRRLKEVASAADDTFAHNDWMQMVADFGFIGLVLVAGAFLFNWRAGFLGFVSALRERMLISSRPQSNSAAFEMGGLSALTAFAVHSFLDFNMQIPANALLAAAVAGMLANAGISSAGVQSGWRRVSRWITGIVSGLAGLFLLGLLLHSTEPEWKALQAENALLSKDPVRAVDLANQGLGVSSQHSRLRRILGEALLQSASSAENARENRVLAAYHLRRSSEYDPEERWNRLMLAISLSSLRKTTAARTAHIEAIRLDPGNPIGYEYYALFLEGSGKWDDAIRAYEVALALPETKFATQRLRALQQMKKSAPPQTGL